MATFTNYGSIPDCEPALASDKEVKEEVLEETPRSSGWSRTLGAALVSTVVVGSVLYAANTGDVWSSGEIFKSGAPSSPSSSSESTTWTIYKMTTATTVGTYEAVESFANTYLCETAYTDLGCNMTNKVACNLAGSFGIHWVDSSIFNDLSGDDRSISDWNTYVESLGTSSFNPFMHNKIQLFIPDLSTLYSKLTTDGISFNKRLSMSEGSSTDDIAHLSIQMPNTGTTYEIIGPSSTLTTDDLTGFSEWESTSCPTSHVVPYSLATLTTMFDSMVDTASESWETTSGLKTPMGVMIQIPMSGVSSPKLQDTMDLVSTMSGNDFTTTTTTTDGNSCTVASININGITVRYVENSADFSSIENYDWTVSDWEADVLTSAEKFVDTENTMYSWNRYLDHHIGIYIPDATSDCTGYYDYIADTIADNAGEFDYGLRVATTFGVGTHYYTATAGLRSWEFNPQYCAMSNETDICGCLADNSYVDYMDTYGYACLK